MQCRHRELRVRPRLHVDVEIQRLGRYPIDGSADAINRTRDHPCGDAFGDGHLGYLVCGYVLVLGRRHLHRRRQVDPELKAPHEAVLLPRHLGVDDATTGRHPLDAARAEKTGIPLVVAVFHRPRQHIGDGFETAMRMVGETRKVVTWIIRAEFIEQQKRIEMIELRRCNYARHAHTGPVRRWMPLQYPADGSRFSHRFLPATLLRPRPSNRVFRMQHRETGTSSRSRLPESRCRDRRDRARGEPVP